MAAHANPPPQAGIRWGFHMSHMARGSTSSRSVTTANTTRTALVTTAQAGRIGGIVTDAALVTNPVAAMAATSTAISSQRSDRR